MKLEAKNVTFLPVLPWFGRRSAHFVGRGNTIQLVETALVIEGNRKTFGLPIIDLLFQQALSEWTTITIPYSRVESCRHTTLWKAKIAFLSCVALFVVLPCFATMGLSLTSGLNADDLVVMALPLFGVALLTVYVLVRFLGSRHHLVFRRPNGRRVKTSFRIRKRALREAFDQRLAANRRAAASDRQAMADTVAGGSPA